MLQDISSLIALLRINVKHSFDKIFRRRTDIGPVAFFEIEFSFPDAGQDIVRRIVRGSERSMTCQHCV